MFARLFAVLPLVLLVAACDTCKLPCDDCETGETGGDHGGDKGGNGGDHGGDHGGNGGGNGSTTVTQCNTGPVQCCNQVQSIDQATDLLNSFGLLSAALGLGAQVGSDCSPIDVLGIGSGCQVSQQPVCCENNNFNGLVNIGCTPINIQL